MSTNNDPTSVPAGTITVGDLYLQLFMADHNAPAIIIHGNMKYGIRRFNPTTGMFELTEARIPNGFAPGRDDAT